MKTKKFLKLAKAYSQIKNSLSVTLAMLEEDLCPKVADNNIKLKISDFFIEFQKIFPTLLVAAISSSLIIIAFDTPLMKKAIIVGSVGVFFLVLFAMMVLMWINEARYRARYRKCKKYLKKETKPFKNFVKKELPGIDLSKDFRVFSIAAQKTYDDLAECNNLSDKAIRNLLIKNINDIFRKEAEKKEKCEHMKKSLEEGKEEIKKPS